MTIERRLSKAQATAVVALIERRSRLEREYRENEAAITEILETYRVLFGLPEEAEYRFDGTPDEMRIVNVPKAAQTTEKEPRESDEEFREALEQEIVDDVETLAAMDENSDDEAEPDEAAQTTEKEPRESDEAGGKGLEDVQSAKKDLADEEERDPDER